MELNPPNPAAKAAGPRKPAPSPWPIVFLFGISGVIWLAFRFIPEAIDESERTIPIQYIRVICLLAVAATAVGLFFIRRRSLFYYGMVEVAFALVSAWNALGTLRPGSDPDFLILMASAYLIVRGLVNLDEGRRKRRPSNSPDQYV